MAQEEQLPQSKELLKERTAVAPRPLAQIVPQLAKYGGFEFIKTIVDGTENMDPTKKARKAMFLEEEDNKADRKKLKKRLQTVADLLSAHDNVADMIAEAEQKAVSASETLKANLLNCLSQTE